MKRIRLSTVMLLVVIAALSFALLDQRQREAQRLAELEAMRAEQNADVARFILESQRALESFWSAEPSATSVLQKAAILTTPGAKVDAEGRPEGDGAATSPGTPARNEPNPPAGPGRPD